MDRTHATSPSAAVWETARALAAAPSVGGLLLRRLPDDAGTRHAADAAVDQQLGRAKAVGWSDDDLDELQRRRLKVPVGASAIERQVRLLALLLVLPPLPAATVRPAEPTAGTAAAAMLAKIRALLAKAESTTFPDEAEAFTAKAQELMARHRVDQAALGDVAVGQQPGGQRIWHDDPYAGAKAALLGVVAHANRCRAVFLPDLRISHVVGFPGDLALVELLHTSLLTQAVTAMAAAGPQVDRRGRSRTRSFRQSFLEAFAHRIGVRLRAAAATGESEALADHETDLLPVLARREAEVESAVAQAFPRLRRRRGSVSNGAGWAAGTAAADRADLSVGAPLPS